MLALAPSPCAPIAASSPEKGALFLGHSAWERFPCSVGTDASQAATGGGHALGLGVGRPGKGLRLQCVRLGGESLGTEVLRTPEAAASPALPQWMFCADGCHPMPAILLLSQAVAHRAEPCRVGCVLAQDHSSLRVARGPQCQGMSCALQALLRALGHVQPSLVSVESCHCPPAPGEHPLRACRHVPGGFAGSEG